MVDPHVEELVARALAEDVGDGDVTTAATVDPDARARALVLQKASGAISGLDVALAVFEHLDPALRVVERCVEGEWRDAGGLVVRIEGRTAALLSGERTALNFLGRLSGIATLTARVVRAVRDAGGTATILDTRKTTPGLRELEKAAVAAGGAANHRRGLWDAFLIKENHIAAAGGIAAAVERARAARPDLPVAVEVRTHGEIRDALAVGAPRLLLDNMTPDEIRAAVEVVQGRAELEASGGVTPENVLVYSTISGLDYVSMGALTHSAPVLDLSLLLEPLPST